MMYFIVSDSDWSDRFNDLEEAKRLMESWKENYLCDGVSLDDSYIELREADDSYDPDLDNSIVLKRFEVVVDEQQHKDLGTPEENGMDFAFWAKWQEVQS